MNWYKKAQNFDGKLIAGFSEFGAHFVVFKVGDKYYKYQLSFPDWIAKVKQMATHSQAKALNWAKKKASNTWEVTGDYHQPKSVVRDIE